MIMIFKVGLFLTLISSQVFTSAFLQLRSLESRQANGCPICSTVSGIINGCITIACGCNPSVASDAQSCVTCVVTNYPTPANIAIIQNFTDSYSSICSGVPGVPPVTIPVITSSTLTTRSTVFVPPPGSTPLGLPTAVTHSTVTDATPPPTIDSKSTVTGTLGPSAIPGISTTGKATRVELGFKVGAVMGVVYYLLKQLT